MGMGLNREANEEYMEVLNRWNKTLIAMGELSLSSQRPVRKASIRFPERFRNILRKEKDFHIP